MKKHVTFLFVLCLLLLLANAQAAKNGNAIHFQACGSEVMGLKSFKAKANKNAHQKTVGPSVQGFIYSGPIVAAVARNSSARVIIGPKAVVAQIAARKNSARHWSIYN